MKIKKIIYSLLVWAGRGVYVLIILGLLVLTAVSRPDFLLQKAERILNARLPMGMSVSGLSFSKVELSFAVIVARDVSFSFRQAQNHYLVFAEKVFLTDAACLVSVDACHVLVENADISGGDWTVYGVKGDARIAVPSKEVSARGFVSVDSVRYKEYGITDARFYFDVEGRRAVFHRAGALAYQGRIMAEGSYQFPPDEKIEVAFEFEGVDTDQIDAVSSKLKGAVSGKGSYAGALKKIGSLELEFKSVSSEMERTLLKYLMGDVGNSLAFLPFAKILESAEFIHLENFQGRLHNLDEDSVSVELNVESRQLNLQLNPNITINLR